MINHSDLFFLVFCLYSEYQPNRRRETAVVRKSLKDWSGLRDLTSWLRVLATDSVNPENKLPPFLKVVQATKKDLTDL